MNKKNLNPVCGIVIGLAMCFTVASCGQNTKVDLVNTDTIYADVAESTAETTIETTVVTTVATSNSTTTSAAITTAETTVETTNAETEAPAIEAEVVIVPETEAPVTEPVPVTPETEPEEVKPVEEYLVYKPSTYYIHRNTCRWNKDDAYRIDSADGLVARLCDECSPECSGFEEYVPPVKETPSSDGLTYFGYFGRVTYYPATAYYDGVCGGSGRTLIGYGDYGDGIRGSVASRTLYETYGYNRNGRTTVYLEFPGYSEMNGFYYVDDCCRDYGVIDVFVWSGWSCPFYNAGVIEANCYI